MCLRSEATTVRRLVWWWFPESILTVHALGNDEAFAHYQIEMVTLARLLTPATVKAATTATLGSQQSATLELRLLP